MQHFISKYRTIVCFEGWLATLTSAIPLALYIMSASGIASHWSHFLYSDVKFKNFSKTGSVFFVFVFFLLCFFLFLVVVLGQLCCCSLCRKQQFSHLAAWLTQNWHRMLSVLLRPHKPKQIWCSRFAKQKSFLTDLNDSLKSIYAKPSCSFFPLHNCPLFTSSLLRPFSHPSLFPLSVHCPNLSLFPSPFFFLPLSLRPSL